MDVIKKFFKSENYVKCFCDQLLENLTETSLIILENCSYCRARSEYVHSVSFMRKNAVLAERDRIGICRWAKNYIHSATP